MGQIEITPLSLEEKAITAGSRKTATKDKNHSHALYGVAGLPFPHI